MENQLMIEAAQLLSSSAEDLSTLRSADPSKPCVPSRKTTTDLYRRTKRGGGRLTGPLAFLLLATLMIVEKVIYPRRLTSVNNSPNISGGTPLSKEEAIRLRQVVFGPALTPPRRDWRNGGFRFFPPGVSHVGYGLQAPSELTQPLVMAVQTRVIKHLRFQRRADASDADALFSPRRVELTESLARALTDTLWLARTDGCCSVCLCGELAQPWGDADYIADSVTERVHRWTFTERDRVYEFISSSIKEFESPEGSGCLLFLYSLVFSRGISSIWDDLGEQQTSLLTSLGGVTHALTTLVLTGQATPHLHNGTLRPQTPPMGQKSSPQRELRGVSARSEIGFLLVPSPPEVKPGSKVTADAGGGVVPEVEVGSRLKTPLLPIWLTCCQGRHGVLFHLSRELTRDYHAEHRFDLHYYSGDGAHLSSPTLLTVDTKSAPLLTEEDVRPRLNAVILSKWPDAAIDWHETEPYV